MRWLASHLARIPRWIALCLIRFYRSCISPLFPACCRFLPMRLIASHPPRMSPNLSIAVTAYCEQDGTKRQHAGNIGEIHER